MEIRKAKKTDISKIKKLVDSFEEMDTIPSTFPKDYYERLISKGILLVSTIDNDIVGTCFGTYNVKENWADLLGLVVKEDVRKKGIGSFLVLEFEKIVKEKKIKTIDLYADKKQIKLFSNMYYTKGRTYTAFRKKL